MFWQCFESWTTEAFPDGLPPFYEPTFYNDPCRVRKETQLKTLVQDFRRKNFGSNKDDSHNEAYMSLLVDIRNQWRDFIHSYSGYKLTKESDIFVALQGIVQDIFADTLQDQLIGGLSEQHLMQELCWRSCVEQHGSSKPHRTAKWRAPSWSWASTKVPVEIPCLSLECEEFRYDMAKLVNWHAPAKPSGELIEAELWVECRLLCVEARQEGWHATMTFEGVEKTFEETGIYMDDPCPDDQVCHARKVFLMPTSHHNYTNGARNYIEGVALDLLDDKEETYKRVGCFNISIEWDGSLDHEASKQPFGQVMKMLEATKPKVVRIV